MGDSDSLSARHGVVLDEPALAADLQAQLLPPDVNEMPQDAADSADRLAGAYVRFLGGATTPAPLPGGMRALRRDLAARWAARFDTASVEAGAFLGEITEAFQAVPATTLVAGAQAIQTTGFVSAARSILEDAARRAGRGALSAEDVLVELARSLAAGTAALGVVFPNGVMERFR